MSASSEAERVGWPPALVVAPSGRLELDGCDLMALARERGTPLWVLSRSTIERNFESLMSVFKRRYPRCELAYSIKANNTRAVIRVLHRLGANMDCSSEYELQLALMAGVPPSDIVLNGGGKSDSMLRYAATLGVRELHVDSLDEIRRLAEIADGLGARLPCMVRVQLTYEELLAQDPSFLPHLRSPDKQGVAVRSGEASAAIKAIAAAPSLEFAGLHHHLVFAGFRPGYAAEHALMHRREAVRELCEFANTVKRDLGLSVERLNLGGGIRAGSSFLRAASGSDGEAVAREFPSADEFADAVFDTLESTLEADALPIIGFESGAHMVWNAGIMLTTVAEVKEAVRRDEPLRRYVFIDGSALMFTLRRTTKLSHPVVLVEDPERESDFDCPVEVVGQTCMVDTVASGIHLPPIGRGDVLALLDQGAYCETMSTQMNAFPRPEVMLLTGASAVVVKRRETLADVYARDSIPPDLWARS